MGPLCSNHLISVRLPFSGVGKSELHSFKDQILFFDLAGTLVNLDSDLLADHARVLRDIGLAAKRVVLVTGQASDDFQLNQVLRVLRDAQPSRVVVYVTRGGRRLVLEGEELRDDIEYLARNALDEQLRNALMSSIAHALTVCGVTPLIPIRCIDEVAIRVNVSSDQRQMLVDTLSKQLVADGIVQVHAVAEGRTSVFVMREGVGKQKAVENELRLLQAERAEGVHAFYFGNEFLPGGNDRELLGVEGLTIYALGPVGELPTNAQARTVGTTPDDLYTILNRPHDSSPETLSLPAICLSLGGTKIQVGGLTNCRTILTSEQIFWRNLDRYVRCDESDVPDQFCNGLAEDVIEFLANRGYAIRDVGLLGVAFPGPCDGGRWYSNNLSTRFRDGLNLECELRAALIHKSSTDHCPAVRVVFDAQCDAGGELHHPAGQLRRDSDRQNSGAIVLNLATGIAAGIVKNGRVLITDRDFQEAVGKAFDSGAGQFGRHLWYYPGQEHWRYVFAPHGRLPQVTGAIRMTDRLSGPAVAARLLLLLGKEDAFPVPMHWSSPIEIEKLKQLYSQLSKVDTADGGGQAAHLVRSASQPIAEALLAWADRVYFEETKTAASQCVSSFAHTAASELAGAIKCLRADPNWNEFTQNIVLTGGLGLRFLALSDQRCERSFVTMLRERLPPDCQIRRSCLKNAVEREIYMFLPESSIDYGAN